MDKKTVMGFNESGKYGAPNGALEFCFIFYKYDTPTEFYRAY